MPTGGGGGGGAGDLGGKPGGTAPAWPQAGASYAQGGDGIGSGSIPWLPTSHGDSGYFRWWWCCIWLE